jgi:MFS family permease
MGLSPMWQGVFAARLLDRVGAGTRSAPRDALVAASVDEKNRGRAFGLEGFGDNAGAFLGPLLAALLLYAFRMGLRPIFYLALVPGLLAFLMIVLVRERPVAIQAKAKIDAGFGRFPKAYWLYLLATALFALGNSSNAFLILQIRGDGASLPATILVYAGFNLVAALISYPAGTLSDHLGRRNVLLGVFLVFAIAYLGFALTHDVVLIGTLFVFYGLYQGIFRSVGKAFASDFVPEQLHASGIGWYSATVGIVELIASIVAGLLWDRVGHAAVFYYGAAWALTGSAALLLLAPSKRAA